MLKAVKKIQAWGNSFGVRLSKGEIKNEGLRMNEDVEVIVIKKSNPARELFGTLKGKIKKPTDKIMEEIDRSFRSRFD